MLKHHNLPSGHDQWHVSVHNRPDISDWTFATQSQAQDFADALRALCIKHEVSWWLDDANDGLNIFSVKGGSWEHVERRRK